MSGFHCKFELIEDLHTQKKIKMQKKESIYELHEDHKEWLSKLDFYKDDIKILRHRLEEVVSKNTDHSVLAEAEKFQNQFIVQNDNIDHIRHFINVEENKIEKIVNANPVAVDHRKIEHSEVQKDLIDNFEKNFKQLRIDFNAYIAKWI